MNAVPLPLLNLAFTRHLVDPASLHMCAVARLLQSGSNPSPLNVLPWVEQQGLGVYQPQPLPYPLATQQTAMIWGEAEDFDLPALAALLAERYPPHHTLTLLVWPDETIAHVSLAELAAIALTPATQAAVIVPALPLPDDRRSIDRLHWVVQRLLGPDGCPWDVRQTPQSLRGSLLEEVYEALEALDSGDMAQLCEELGDVLLHVFAQSEMARQAGSFTLADVVQRVSDKLIFRHPHVFGQAAVADSSQVLRNWEELKTQELAAKGKARSSALDGVPAALPALAAAQSMARKAIRVGFTWANIDQVWAKLEEELAELRAAVDPADRQAELGDLLFAVATLAHWLDIDAEAALREASARYRQRFMIVEQRAASAGRALRECSLNELVAWWIEAKGLVATNKQGDAGANSSVSR